jgi:hypothetical protein
MSNGSGVMKHLSPSKIESMLKCGWQTRFRYIDKVPEPAIGHMAAGSAFHAVIEWALLSWIAGGALPGAQEMDDRLPELWEKEIRDRESKEGFVGWEWNGEDPDIVKTQIRALLPYARAEVLSKMKPKLVEEDVKLSLESEVGPFLVWGKLDALEEGGLVTDWKTTSGDVSANKKRMGLGLIHYSFKALELTGGILTSARKVFWVRGSRPRHEIVNYKISQRHRDFYATLATDAWKVTQANAYMPAADGSWWCSKKWCSFWAACMGEIT